MKRNAFLTISAVLTAGILLGDATRTEAADRPNILFLTVDDMSCDSIGAFDCKLPDTSPNIDRLASQGVRFKHVHVQVGNCMPSRNVMQSGRYPHNNGVEGFYQVKEPDYKSLPQILMENGYFTAVKSKVSHSSPYSPYPYWDMVLEPPQANLQRSAEWFHTLTKQAIEASQAAGKPFYLVMNINDPHKPFYGMDKHSNEIDDPLKPTRIFTADEVPVPGFLIDEPIVRKELAHYYSSVRRADDCAGAVLRALDESGVADNTVLMFLSDHGMPLPFAKTCVYHHSTHTPWIVRWPGVTEVNKVDELNMISAVDFTPTILDIVGIAEPEGIDGKSFAPLLHGKKQAGRDMIFKEYNENSGAGRHPMRSVQTRRFGYIFNPWSNGERVFKTATTGTHTYRKMQELAPTDEYIAARLDLFDHRVPEEFYDYEKDPDGLVNLIDHPEYQQEINRLCQALEDWMVETGDHALEAFQGRNDAAVMESYVQSKQAEADARRKKRTSTQRQNPNAKKGYKLITMQLPTSATPGQPITVTIGHAIPDELATQQIHVTIKNGKGQRIMRKIVKASGSGELTVTFDVPATVPGDALQFSAFIGEDYPICLQHINGGPVRVK